MQKSTYDIIVFFIVVIGLILLLFIFIITMAFLYRKRQHQFEQNLAQTKLAHDKAILSTQVEIQEQTFQHISREIHDNINLSLTLAKLNLHTVDWNSREKTEEKIAASIELLSTCIAQLNDLSKSLDADTINRHSLLKALEEELHRIRHTGCLEIEYSSSGTPVYMNSHTELVLFRIIQEALNNIIKHASAAIARLQLDYRENFLRVQISDNGNGFDPAILPEGRHAGLRNMAARVKILGGKMDLQSLPGNGTTLNFTIPFEQYETNKPQPH